MSVSKKTPSRPKAGREARIRATLAKLDELVAANPHLTSRESQERLARHLDHEAHEKGDDDGSEEEDGRR